MRSYVDARTGALFDKINKHWEKKLNIEKIKKNISKIIFVLVFIENLCRLLINHENVQTFGWLELIPLSILVVLTFYEFKNTERAKMLFTIYWAFDFITGFSYLLKKINPVYFSMFPSSSWLFEIIYIIKYSQNQLFVDLISIILLWVGYYFEYKRICKFEKKNYKEVEYKKITVSSVIALVNILILCYSVFIIFNNHFVDMEISSTGISYKKAQIVMVFYFLLEAAIISIPLAIVGLIFELIAKYKNKIGKIINKLLLTLYLLVIIINIIIYEVWY